MQIQLDPEDLEPLIRSIVDETLRKLKHVLPTNGKPEQPAAAQPLLITSKQAAKLLGICERTLWTLANNGEIPAVRIGQSCRFDPADLNRWIDKKKQQPGPQKKPQVDV